VSGAYKPPKEVKVRLRLLKPVRGTLPRRFVAAGQAYDEAGQAYDEARRAYDEARRAEEALGSAWRAYGEARRACGSARRACASEIEALQRSKPSTRSSVPTAPGTARRSFHGKRRERGENMAVPVLHRERGEGRGGLLLG
jgi:hypothetical protein